MGKFKNFTICILCACFISIFLWIIYASFCFSKCGMIKTMCTCQSVYADVAICQDKDQNNLPYTGYADFCLNVVNRFGDNETVCVDRVVSCAKSKEDALSEVQRSFHVNDMIDCWYQLPADPDGYWIYIDWSDIMSRLDGFLKFNIVCDIILGGLILTTVLIWVVIKLRSRCHPEQRYDEELVVLI